VCALAITLFLVTILAAGLVLNIADIGSVYAQNESASGGFVPGQDFGTEGIPVPSSPPSPSLQQSPPSQPTQPTQNSNYQTGYTIGLVLGSIVGPTQGANARYSGLAADPRNSYQPLTQDVVCFIYQDLIGTTPLNASASTCDQSQQQVNDFFQGFTNGRANGYGFGFLTGYYVDQVFRPQGQQAGQPQTQPPVTSEGLFGPRGAVPMQPGTQMVPVPPSPEGTQMVPQAPLPPGQSQTLEQ